MGIQRTLGISYTTAWKLLHKLRRAMVRPGRDALNGEVEVDETYIGGLEEGAPGRKAKDKALVLIAVELRGKGLGRIRLKMAETASGDNLMAFINEHIQKVAQS